MNNNPNFLIIPEHYSKKAKEYFNNVNFKIQECVCKITELESQIETLRLDIKGLQKRDDY